MKRAHSQQDILDITTLPSTSSSTAPVPAAETVQPSEAIRKKPRLAVDSSPEPSDNEEEEQVQDQDEEETTIYPTVILRVEHETESLPATNDGNQPGGQGQQEDHEQQEEQDHYPHYDENQDAQQQYLNHIFVDSEDDDDDVNDDDDNQQQQQQQQQQDQQDEQDHHRHGYQRIIIPDPTSVVYRRLMQCFGSFGWMPTQVLEQNQSRPPSPSQVVPPHPPPQIPAESGWARNSANGPTMSQNSPLSACVSDLDGIMYNLTDDYFYCGVCRELIGYYPEPDTDVDGFQRIMSTILAHRSRSPKCVRPQYFDSSIIRYGPLPNPALNGLERKKSFDDCFNQPGINHLSSMGIYQWGTGLRCAYCAFTMPVASLVDRELDFIVQRHAAYGDDPAKRCRTPINCDINKNMVIRPASKNHVKCCVCLTNRNNMLLQCNHLVCAPCESKLTNCPVCRIRLNRDWTRQLFSV